MMDERVSLGDPDVDGVMLLPGAGGSIARFRAGGQDIFRPADDAALAAGNARRLGVFPLVPFSNRIADGRFTWQGIDHRLRPNFPGEPHAVHGEGFQAGWTVAGQGDDHAVLVHDHDGRADGAWPFPYRATQRFDWQPGRLAVTLTIENRASVAAPAGLGLHPYFALGAGTRLTVRADRLWQRDDRKLPTAAGPVPAALALDRGGDFATLGLDHCLSGWDGRAVLDWPDRGLTLEMTADPVFAHVMVASPLSPVHGAVEPVTHVPDPFAIEAREPGASGLATLAPGQALSGTVRFVTSR